MTGTIEECFLCRGRGVTLEVDMTDANAWRAGCMLTRIEVECRRCLGAGAVMYTPVTVTPLDKQEIVK